jgi:hypothetical protein
MNAGHGFLLSERMAQLGISRTEVAAAAGRTLGHVSMSLNGQRPMSRYLTEVIWELIKEKEREAKAEGRTEV